MLCIGKVWEASAKYADTLSKCQRSFVTWYGDIVHLDRINVRGFFGTNAVFPNSTGPCG